MTAYDITLIANPTKEPLTTGLITDLKRKLKPYISSSDINSQWLSKTEAIDLSFSSEKLRDLKIALRAYLQEKPFDWALQKREERRKKLLISDMDSTIIEQECIDELAAEIDIYEQVADITKRAMKGELDFAEALRERVVLLRGMNTKLLEKVYTERITLMEGASTLVQTMRKHGAYTLLISGGFTFFASRVAEAVGFEDALANRLEIEDNLLTGSVLEPILDQQVKYGALVHAAKERNIPISMTMAVGDGANDVAMIKEAGLGVAYHAKRVVQQEANCTINHGNLTALLYLQGYHASEFIDKN